VFYCCFPMRDKERGQDSPETEDGLPESREIQNVEAELERYADSIAESEARKFWEKRPLDPEPNGNGVTFEELMDQVLPKFRENVKENMVPVKLMVDESPNPRETFDRISTMMFPVWARSLIESHYEMLRTLKKSGIDELTGLPNKKMFKRNLRACVKNYERYGTTFSVIIFDLDHFKLVNDTHGHLAGDQVLQEVARRLTADVRLRELDAAMRVGGEEFAIILPSTPKEGACIVAHRVWDVIRKGPFNITDKARVAREIEVTASLGVAEYEEITEDKNSKGDDVVRRADIALYVNKGEEPDEKNETFPQRDCITCDRHRITDEDILAYKEKFKGEGRSSFPAPNKEK